RGRSHQRVDCRTVRVAAGAGSHGDRATTHGEVESGWRNVDTTRLDRIAIFRVDHGEMACAGKNLGQHAANAIRKVERDEDGCWKFGRDVLDNALKGADSASRSADDDDVEIRHRPPAAKSGHSPVKEKIPVLV